MNIVLNKYIRDKQTPEVIEKARKKAKLKKQKVSENDSIKAIDPRLIELFIRDATKSLAILKNIVEKGTLLDENDLRTYLIHTHGIKNVLTYFNKLDLSAIARKLEQSGQEKNIEVITSETPSFLQSLQAFVDELAPTIRNKESKTPDINEDTVYLHEKLLIIKKAGEEYDETTIENAITELKEKKWATSTEELLDTIANYLLHSDFEEIAGLVNKFLNGNGIDKN
jgi:HPt (histidine-containing phosphotransfer) domain-containing protein